MHNLDLFKTIFVYSSTLTGFNIYIYIYTHTHVYCCQNLFGEVKLPFRGDPPPPHPLYETL